MSTNVGSIHYDLKLDTDKFERAVDKVTDRLENIGNKMRSTGKNMTAFLTLPIIGGFGMAIKAASDLEETINKVNVSFGDSARTVHEWGRTSLTTMGLARQSALDAAALYGDMATGMGIAQDKAAGMATQLTQLGADLASFKNISFERAQIALAGVFTGETEALKGLGIVMTQANLEAFALSQGIKKNITDMTQAELVTLRLGYVMSVTKNAQGDFARTSEGAANQTRFTTERMKDLSAELGQRLLPIYIMVLEKLNGLIDRFNRLTPAQQNQIILAAALVAALGPLIYIIGVLTSAIRGAIVVLTLLAAHPIVFALLAIAATLIYLQARFGLVTNAINAVRNAFSSFGGVANLVHFILRNVLGVAWGFYGGFVDAGWALITAFANGIRGAMGRAIGAVRDGLGAIRRLLPFSDAKEGPLRDLTLSGRRFSETFARGILQGSGAIYGATATAMAVGSPMMGGGLSSGSVSTTIHGNINIGSNADARSFLEQLSRNQELAARSVATRPGSLG